MFPVSKALRALADGDVCHSNTLGAAGVPTCEDPKGLVLFISVKPKQNGAAGVLTCEDPKGLVFFISFKPCGLWQTGTSATPIILTTGTTATPIFWEPQVSPPAKTRWGLSFHFCKALRALADEDVCHSNYTHDGDVCHSNSTHDGDVCHSHILGAASILILSPRRSVRQHAKTPPKGWSSSSLTKSPQGFVKQRKDRSC